MRSKISSIVANLPTAILFISSNSLTHSYPAKIFMPLSSRRFKWTSKGDPSAISLTAVFQQMMAAGPSSLFESVSKRLTRISKPRVSSPMPILSDPKINTFLFGSFKFFPSLLEINQCHSHSMKGFSISTIAFTINSTRPP